MSCCLERLYLPKMLVNNIRFCFPLIVSFLASGIAGITLRSIHCLTILFMTKAFQALEMFKPHCLSLEKSGLSMQESDLDAFRSASFITARLLGLQKI